MSNDINKGLMQWRRGRDGQLALMVKDKGSTEFKPFTQSVMYTPVKLDKSSFAPTTPGFRTAQIALQNGYSYIKTVD